MKSQQQEKKYQTNCQDCLCAEYEGKTQTGCALNRIEIFKDRGEVSEVYDAENREFYIIDRICNGYRDPNWNGGKLDKDLILSDISVHFGILVDTENIRHTFEEKGVFIEKTNKDTIENFVEKIKSCKYDLSKISIALSNRVGSKNFGAVAELFNQLINIPVKCITINHNEEKISGFYRNVLKGSFSNNFQFYTVTDLNLFDLDLLNKVNDKITIDLDKFSVAESKSNQFILKDAFKFHLNTFLDYDLILENFITVSKQSNYFREL